MLKERIKSNPSLFLGLLLILIFLGWKYHQVRILSFNKFEVQNSTTEGVKPIKIESYPIGINIKIQDSSIVDGVWAIHPDSANYLISSSRINKNGNIIIYGHNKTKIFGPIRWIKIGAKILVLGDDNKSYVYEVIKTDIVSPNDLSYISPKDSEVLTLYTCTGFMDSKRFIVVAVPAK